MKLLLINGSPRRAGFIKRISAQTVGAVIALFVL